MSDEQANTLRRLDNMIRLATVTEVDPATARIRVSFQNNTSAWLPWVAGRAGGVRRWSMPSVDEQVVLICPQGETEQGVLLPSLYKEAFPAPSADPADHLTLYEDGALVAYNDITHTLRAVLPEGGTTTLVSDGGVAITGDITITGNVTLSGNLSASGDVADGTGTLQANRDVFNSHTHGSGPPPNEKQ